MVFLEHLVRFYIIMNYVIMSRFVTNLIWFQVNIYLTLNSSPLTQHILISNICSMSDSMWRWIYVGLCSYVELHAEEMNYFRTNINHHAFNLILVVHPYIANIRMNLFLQVCNILKPPFLSSWYWFWIQALISKESERKGEREGILTAIMAIYQVLTHQSLLKFYDL